MRALNSLEDVLAAWRADELDDRMVIRLPTFGGGEPSSGTSGVWSWDATRLLIGTCATDARIVNRAAYEMGRMKSPAKTRAARTNGKLGGRPRQGSLTPRDVGPRGDSNAQWHTSEPITVAALYVEKDGIYSKAEGVDLWPEERDARLYAGPWPVVAHPPCERWGRWAGPDAGKDDGRFRAAFAAVGKFGGVLEHPEASKAWARFAIPRPERIGKWRWFGSTQLIPRRLVGWTCCVEQGHYGHRARKMTWLFAALPYGIDPPELKWGPSVATIGPRPGRDPVRERRIGAVQRMCRAERRATPPAFRDLLLSIARAAL